MYLDVITISRKYFNNATLGELVLPSGQIIKTLERPWLNNAPNISCIPEGIYYVKWLERSASGKYKRVWHVQGVEGRSGILFHAGNYVRNSLGCILTGMSHGYLASERAVLSSGVGLNKMRKELSGKDFLLHIC